MRTRRAASPLLDRGSDDQLTCLQNVNKQSKKISELGLCRRICHYSSTLAPSPASPSQARITSFSELPVDTRSPEDQMPRPRPLTQLPRRLLWPANTLEQKDKKKDKETEGSVCTL